jgi:hypothetical protein
MTELHIGARVEIKSVPGKLPLLSEVWGKRGTITWGNINRLVYVKIDGEPRGGYFSLDELVPLNALDQFLETVIKESEG